MGNNYRKVVHLVVDRTYFDKCFEPERKKLQTKLGVRNLSQGNFTAYLAASGARLKFPKRSDKFTPKKPVNRGFRISL